VAGARVDDKDRGLRRVQTVVEAVVADAGHAQQGVVGRAREPAGVEQDLVVEVEQRRFPGPLVRQHVVGALPQGVPEED
jgi:hypothetical protein